MPLLPEDEDLDWDIPIENLSTLSLKPPCSDHQSLSQVSTDRDTPDLIDNSYSDESDEEIDTTIKPDVATSLNKPDFSDLDDNFHIKPYQLEAITWLNHCETNTLHGCRGALLSLKMGLGKTIIAIAHCMSTKSHSVYPTLVVCSKTVLYTWKQELAKFFGDSCKYLIFYKNDMKKSLYENIDIETLTSYHLILTTYDTVMQIAKRFDLPKKQFEVDSMNRNLYINHAVRPSTARTSKTCGPLLLFRTPFHRIIADEIHGISNPKSARFYAMMCLYGDYKIGLSGTPIQNYSSDMYSIFRFLGYDQVTLPKQFSVSTYNRDHLHTRVMYRDYQDVGETLPDVNHHQVLLELKGNERELYNYYFKATKKIYRGFREGIYNYSNVLVLFLRLRQICVSSYTILAESSRNYVSKPVDLEDSDFEEDVSVSQKVLQKISPTLDTWVKDKHSTSGILSTKITATINIINKLPIGEKVLIFTSFIKVIDVLILALKTLCPKKKYLTLDGDVTGHDRNSTLDLFKQSDSNYDIMFISYKVGSEGLTLVEANHIIHMENWWNPVVQEQAESRVSRLGQTKVVNIWKLIIKDSIEERIEKICDEKRLLREDFLLSKKKDSRPDAQAMADILNLQY